MGRNNSYNTQKSIEPRPPTRNSRTLRGQSTQKLISKDPTLAQVSLPSPIYGLEESVQTNRKQSNPTIDTQQFLTQDETQATVSSETSQISKKVDSLDLETLAQLDQSYEEDETQ